MSDAWCREPGFGSRGAALASYERPQHSLSVGARKRFELMLTSADALYASLGSWQSLEDLITAAEAEGQYLECKAPHAPVVDKGLRSQLCTLASGFANSGGGVVLFGVSTTTKLHSGLDVLAQLEPIGSCDAFAKRIDRLVGTLTTPTVKCPPARVLRRSASDSKGIVVLLVPGTLGDPVQSLDDRRFYIRAGAEFVEMPYPLLKRMFAGSEAPDIEPVFDGRLVSRLPNGTWRIPIIAKNRSTHAGRDVDVTIGVMNPDACASIAPEEIRDISNVNPSERIFVGQLDRPLHRGFSMVVGALVVGMKTSKRAKRVLNLDVRIFCSGMRAKKWIMRVQLAKKGFSVKKVREAYLDAGDS